MKNLILSIIVTAVLIGCSKDESSTTANCSTWNKALLVGKTWKATKLMVNGKDTLPTLISQWSCWANTFNFSENGILTENNAPGCTGIFTQPYSISTTGGVNKLTTNVVITIQSFNCNEWTGTYDFGGQTYAVTEVVVK